MKLEKKDNLLIIYLKNKLVDNIDFTNKEELEKYFKELFIKLKEYYNIKISGYYNINVYIDRYYGVVLELEKEEIDYYSYFNNQVDMHIITEDIDFLYLIDDYFITDYLKNYTLFLYKNKYYILPDKNINFDYLLENSKIIYNNTKEIIKFGKILK